MGITIRCGTKRIKSLKQSRKQQKHIYICQNPKKMYLMRHASLQTLRSAFASVQSDQISLPEETLGPWILKKHPAKTPQTAWMRTDPIFHCGHMLDGPSSLDDTYFQVASYIVIKLINKNSALVLMGIDTGHSLRRRNLLLSGSNGLSVVLWWANSFLF